jgi:hypothetical protein
MNEEWEALGWFWMYYETATVGFKDSGLHIRHSNFFLPTSPCQLFNLSPYQLFNFNPFSNPKYIANTLLPNTQYQRA